MNTLSILICALVTAGCFFVGSTIPISEQLPIYESLRNTSAIIFGVMGAWIAILYPEALLRIYGKIETVEAEQQSKSIKQLISPMVLSTIIVSLVLIVSLIAPVLRRIDYLVEHTTLVRSFSFALLGGLTFAQLWALIATLAPTESLKSKIDFTIRKRKAVQQMFPGLKSKDAQAPKS
jgi:H+/Cl- antiporter ClcA